MSRRGVFDQTPKDPIRRISARVKEIKVGTMGIKIERVIMLEMETITLITTSTRVTVVTKTIGVDHLLDLKI